MKGENGLWPHAPEMAGRELEESLGLLDESQGMLRLIMIGLILQYASLDVQRQKLLDPETAGPEPQCMQASASLITLGALFGFQRQAERLACQEAQSGSNPDMMDVKLGATSILVTMIRLLRLVLPSQTGSMANNLEETELISEPVQ